MDALRELIDPETARWRFEVLDAVFPPYEANIIRCIPISSRLPADKLIWAESLNGQFSMRSAYAVAVRLSCPISHGATLDNSLNWRFCKQVWGLPLPHKIRHFAWEACRNILPTKVNLLKRRVLQDDICEECRLVAETSGHLFWTC